MKKYVYSIWNFLLNLQKGIMIISSILILLGLVATVLLRYIFQADLYGLEELILIPAFWMYFMGASYGTHLDTHITADLTKVYIKDERIKSMVQLLNTVICLVIAIVFTFWANSFVIWSINSGGNSSAWKYPLYIPQSAIMIGFILMSLYLAVKMVNDAKILVARSGKGL
ncbi:TRAP-type C4-dicarboxylate transport system, small permease component [Lentibacillus halodurans]|uniref:TRAP-type C4-dicarboxylate transport system, small permease component n=1 Tax=Lentibacillus halodurans TaxID=237679 RepID=A0A1I0XLV5_9BACI|nr:TRAP transporter small permease [Lentibacillus halodurans]SFB02089.1 TRAP-type C4-dicarboxylate transport system, small permease component [Lentibacillus halodurans]